MNRRKNSDGKLVWVEGASVRNLQNTQSTWHQSRILNPDELEKPRAAIGRGYGISNLIRTGQSRRCGTTRPHRNYSSGGRIWKNRRGRSMSNIIPPFLFQIQIHIPPLLQFPLTPRTLFSKLYSRPPSFNPWICDIESVDMNTIPAETFTCTLEDLIIPATIFKRLTERSNHEGKTSLSLFPDFLRFHSPLTSNNNQLLI